MEDLDGGLELRICGFLKAAESPSIDLGNLVRNTEEMGWTKAAAIAIAHADPAKAADLTLLVAGFLTEIDADSDGITVIGGYDACRLLGLLGSQASGAIPALDHCIGLDGSQEVLVRWLWLKAVKAKWKITGDPTAALSVATEMLGDPDFCMVAHAAELLGELGPIAKPVLADLQRLLDHEEEYTRKDVQAAIERILAS